MRSTISIKSTICRVLVIVFYYKICSINFGNNLMILFDSGKFNQLGYTRKIARHHPTK